MMPPLVVIARLDYSTPPTQNWNRHNHILKAVVKPPFFQDLIVATECS